jgi:hypothetical protein
VCHQRLKQGWKIGVAGDNAGGDLINEITVRTINFFHT